ncbi:MAG: PD40 domain-containing protein [Bacteroidales bacterium]|nr:PD40 domain-containing protein [Bacteroidales bacterium]
MKRLLPVAILICCIYLPVSSQDESAEELFYDAEFFYTVEEDFEEAAYLFRQVLRQEPGNANVKFLLGMCYNNILGQEHEGIPHFLEATEEINLKYKANKYTEKKAPHHSWFYLAEAYRKTNQMDESLNALNVFLSLKNFEKSYNVRITEDEIKAVERAKIIRDAELNLRALYFNEPINTPDNDYSGVISANGKMMVWVNSKAFYEAVYMTTRKERDWTLPVLITPQIVSDGDLYPSGLSADGTNMLLVKRQKKGNSDIWYSQYDGLLWSPAQPLHGEVNTNSNEDHASFDPEGNRIYFSSDRRGGVGGLDIYYSDRQPDGQWGDPVNMGEQINTKKDETSAYISPNGSRFIFSSQGHFNMGGFDIFRCEIQEDNSWSQPTNMGFPINTTGDDSYYVPLNDGLSGLYTRFTNEGIGMQDLWYVEILGEDGIIAGGLTIAVDFKGLSHRDFAIIVLDENTGEEIEVLYDAESDTFKALSGPQKSYRVISYKQK